ncbi:FAD:protein FMN transferase [Aerococcus sanguinicola]|uniref:FAD:protein FMN transferase n=1 Tax=Aerococcus sanguinicola TaxID=119206 RepID=A0A109RE69_9LACT|nr:MULTISPECIES: FAD:protein FMN transferase [Aerococcus]AMB94944.1 thiamine biosynthesis protein ApbE [Aerococcus sanguinicola]MDK7050311.1 FAD:protein FMN transferase [Aerococcus sanguinicola]OFT94986.1 thiamine biosynthesis protein ApbE [Aerococcus sp. HMSC23C02]PKZ21806.1 FAD:protein FMN transferase [Aerococcus sanguinicola]
MGTWIDLYVRHDQAKALLARAVQKLYDYNERFSANDPNSQLMQVNQRAGRSARAVDPDLFELIKLGKAESIASKGRLNIAIGPLVKLWGIGFEGAHKPSHQAIEACLERIDPRQIALNEASHEVYLARQGMEIDLGALAKGYFADQIMDDFIQAGAQSAMINLGGNVKVYGPPPKRPELRDWRIGIQDPRKPRGQNCAVLQVHNQSVVTSGGYERKLDVDGHSYQHIFDSRTGYPVENELASVSVLADQSVMAEVWTTRLYPLSLTEIQAELAQAKDYQALVIDKQGRLLASRGLLDHLQVLK